MPSCKDLFLTFAILGVHLLLVAEIKAKAAGVTSAGADKIRDVGRRNTRHVIQV